MCTFKWNLLIFFIFYFHLKFIYIYSHFLVSNSFLSCSLWSHSKSRYGDSGPHLSESSYSWCFPPRERDRERDQTLLIFSHLNVICRTQFRHQTREGGGVSGATQPSEKHFYCSTRTPYLSPVNKINLDQHCQQKRKLFTNFEKMKEYFNW